jgi:hypothetical protein
MEQLTTLIYIIIGFLFFYSFYKIAEKIDKKIQHNKRMKAFKKMYIDPYKKK